MDIKLIIISKLRVILEKILNRISVLEYYLTRDNCENILKAGVNQKYSRPEKPCHFVGLFITHNGEVYPCCSVWAVPKMKIGHINDPDLLSRIKNFYQKCSCQRLKLRKGLPNEKIDIEEINIELSLLCQGKCALCCIGSPDWNGIYSYYDSLTKLIKILKPKSIKIQGGEVLIQKKSLDWVKEIRTLYPEIKMKCITNGNISTDMFDTVEKLFDELSFSFMAFEKETYERIMGMSIDKTILFIEGIAKRRKLFFSMNYLLTPVSVHELPVFLNWAVSMNPGSIFVEDAATMSYIYTHTGDKYWNKIFERTGEKVMRVLLDNKGKILNNDMFIRFSTRSINVLGIYKTWDSFITENNFQNKVMIRWFGK